MARAVASILVVAVLLSALFKKLRSKPKSEAPATDQTKSQGAKSSSDLSHPSGYEYEVFLSFRGPDTRKGFTDFLYHALVDAGVRTFRDNEELRTGEEIGTNLTRAITQSKISIPVFSKNYASSKWCLKELALMLECKNRGNHMILPVFYDVTPGEVRHQTGSYASAFQQHENKYDSDIVQQWRKVLAVVGGFKGWESENVANGHQGELIKLIVKKVLSELKKAQLIVPDTLLGIDAQVEDVSEFDSI